jgi:hypothetical protein
VLLKDVDMVGIEVLVEDAYSMPLDQMQDLRHIIQAAGEMLGDNYVADDNAYKLITLGN